MLKSEILHMLFSRSMAVDNVEREMGTSRTQSDNATGRLQCRNLYYPWLSSKFLYWHDSYFGDDVNFKKSQCSILFSGEWYRTPILGKTHKPKTNANVYQFDKSKREIVFSIKFCTGNHYLECYHNNPNYLTQLKLKCWSKTRSKTTLRNNMPQRIDSWRQKYGQLGNNGLNGIWKHKSAKDGLKNWRRPDLRRDNSSLKFLL